MAKQSAGRRRASHERWIQKLDKLIPPEIRFQPSSRNVSKFASLNIWSMQRRRNLCSNKVTPMRSIRMSGS